eukprot:1465934-Amphidinium_carterae.1
MLATSGNPIATRSLQLSSNLAGTWSMRPRVLFWSQLPQCAIPAIDELHLIMKENLHKPSSHTEL